MNPIESPTLILLDCSFLKQLVRVFFAGLVVSAFSLSAAHAKPPQETLGTLSGMPQGSYSLAQLDHIFDAASLHFRSAVDTARIWLRQGPAASRFRPEAPARRTAVRRPPRTPVVQVPSPAPAYRRTFHVLLNHLKITDRYDDLILKYSSHYDLDPRLVKAIIAAESDFFPGAKSPAGAVGLMQVMPQTAQVLFNIPAEEFPPNRLTDPEFNIMAGTAFLNELFRTAWRRYKMKAAHFKNAPSWLVQRVVAAYNAGTRFLFRSHWFLETRHYVKKVLLFYKSKVTKIPRLEFKTAAPVQTAAPSASLVTSAGIYY